MDGYELNHATGPVRASGTMTRILPDRQQPRASCGLRTLALSLRR